MRSIFLLSLIIYFFILSIKSRIAGLYTYWWFAIFRPHDWDWGGVIVSLKLPFVAALLLVVPSAIQKKFPRLDNIIALLMITWLSLVLIADTQNGCGNIAGLVRTNTFIGLLILFYIVLLTSALISSLKQLYWLTFTLSMSIAFHSGKGGILAMVVGANYYDRHQLSGMFSGSNGYALGSGMLLFFLIFTFIHIKSKFIFDEYNKWYNTPIMLNIYKIFILLMIIGTFYNIVALQSRGAFLATSLGLFLLIILQKNSFRMLFILSIVLGLGLAFAPLPEGYVKRIESAFADTADMDKSASSRAHFWNTAMKMVADRPLGVGPGCYPAYYNQYDVTEGFYGTSRSVHSSHFQILADSGYLGFIIWVLLLLVSYWKLTKIKKLSNTSITSPTTRKIYINISHTLICSQTVFIVGGSFYEYAYNDIIWVIFALTMTVEKLIQRECDSLNRERVIVKSGV